MFYNDSWQVIITFQGLGLSIPVTALTDKETQKLKKAGSGGTNEMFAVCKRTIAHRAAFYFGPFSTPRVFSTHARFRWIFLGVIFHPGV